MVNIYLARLMAQGPAVTSTFYLTLPTDNDVAGFQHVYGEDFDIPVAEGGFVTVTGGDPSLLDRLDPASPGGAAYASSFKVKAPVPTGEASGCEYNAEKTTSTSGSSFFVRMHIESGTPYSGAVKPLLPGANPIDQLYGRWIYRMKLHASTSDAWGTVVDLIDPPTWSSGTGEYGHPENGHFDGNLGAFIRDSDHVSDPNRGGHVIRRNYASYAGADARALPGVVVPDTGLNDMHTYEIRAEPGRTQLITNGVTIWDDTTHPVSDEMGFLMQCGAPGTPVPDTEAIVEIPWISIYKWIG